MRSKLFIFILFSFSLIQGQSLEGYRNYSVEDGLPSNEAYQVFQDSKGYIWIGTDRGVSRFNGYEFKNFTTKDGLPDNTVFAFYEDYSGRIWFNTFNGNVGYYENGKFSPVVKGIDNRKHIISIYVDTTDLVSVIYNYGEKTNECYQFSIRKDSVLIKKNCADYEINKILYSGSSIYHYKIGEKLRYEIYYHQNLLRIYFDNSKYEYKKYSAGSIVGFEEYIYITTLEGNLLKYSTLSKDTLPQIINFFPHQLSSFLIDDDGGEWYTTLDNGLYYKPKGQIGVINHIDPENENEITHFVQQKHFTLLGNNNGELILDYHDSSLSDKVLFHEDENISLKQILVDEEVIYVCGMSKLIVIDSLGRDSVIKSNNIGFVSTSIISKNIWLLTGDKWLCTYNDNNELQKYINPFERRGATMEYAKDTLWIGGMNGLSYFDIKLRKFGKNKKEKILQCRIENLKIKDNVFFLATRNNGLIIKQGNKVQMISENEGIISNYLSDLLISDNNTVWLSTNKGVSKVKIESLKPLKYTINNFSTDDGLLLKQINFISEYGDSIYITTSKGVNVLHKDYNGEEIAPTLYINKLKVNNEHLDISSKYDLSYNQSTIYIDFLGLYYPNAKGLQYKYRLKSEIDSTWYLTSNRSVLFTSLASGDYVFELLVVSPKGIQSKEIKKIHFTINPPWWLTWRFKSLVIVMILTLIYLFFYVNILSYNREISRKLLITLWNKLRIEKRIMIKDIKDGSNTEVTHNQILFIKSDSHYATFHLEDDKTVTTRATFKKILKELNEEKMNFIQIHKSFIVNKNKIEASHNKFLKISSFEIPIGRAYKAKL